MATAFVSLAAIGLLFPDGTTVYADSRSENAGPAASATLPEYRLNVRDKIRVQVFEWRPSQDEVYTWTALNQIYSIDPAGRISLPLVGSVPAIGYTTSELALIVSRQLAKRLNLATLPDTTIEVTDFRPIYVTGAVEKTGEYNYTAGMSVLQGVSLAGGLFRNSSVGGLRLEREWVTTVGNYQGLVRERQRLLAHKARLDAELAQADRIAFPAELQSVSEPQAIEFTASVMSKEQRVFELRKNANDTQLVALNQLQDSLQSEVDGLTKRIATAQTQIDLLNSELSGIQTLTDKGLATQPRLLGLKRNLAELEGQKLAIESDRTRAQQEVSRTKLSKIEYENKRENDLTVELQTTEARLQQIDQETEVDERLLAETKSQVVASPLRLTSATEGKGTADQDEPTVHYTIARQVGENTVDIEATEKTVLQPGDTIKVEMTLPATTVGSSSDDMDAFFRHAPAAKHATPTENTTPLRNVAPMPTKASLQDDHIEPSLQP
ncbi:MAG: polysaccharide biosynthesis/export family protein [Proteobacteria bacterium]|nr:polysaccharide biosynthesis/export family protein [Pseudomonadota bacterium]